MSTHFALKGWGRDGDVFFKSERDDGSFILTTGGDHMRFATLNDAERYKLRTSNLAQWVSVVEKAA